MGLIEKFVEEFGESIEEVDNDVIIVTSAPCIESLVDLDKFQEIYNVTFRTFSFELPKKEKSRWESVRFNNQWFDLNRIRRMINVFLEGTIVSNTFEEQETLLLITKINQDYGIVLAPRKDDREKCYPSYWELEYEWDTIFHEIRFGSDMIL